MVEDKNKKKTLENLFDNIEKSDKGLTLTNTKEAKTRKNRAKLIIATTIGILALIIGGAYYVSNQKTVDVVRSSNSRSTDLGESNNSYTLPVELPKYLSSEWKMLSDDEKKSLQDSQDETIFGDMTSGYPSEEAGFTSDKAKMYNDEGFPNIYYTTATRESLKYQIISYINRLINPIYGGWTEYQYGKQYKTSEMNENIYKDMFSDEYINNNKTNMPFFTDKESNDYGYEWIESKEGLYPRFIGTINEISDIETDDGFNQIKVTSSVTLYANTKKEKITKKYKIVMTLITDEESDSLRINDIKIEEEK